MPITFAHPAIVLPFRYLPKRLYSLTGLIIGSIVPDFEYFIRLKDGSVYGHSWWGMFWYDLPLALVLTFMYHNIVRQELLANMPVYFGKRLLKYADFEWNKYFRSNVAIVILSILLGIASHLIWDSFTHEDGCFVTALDWDNNIRVFKRLMPIYLFLQYASSLLGTLIILIAVMCLPAYAISRKKTIIPYWLLLIGFSIGMIFFHRHFFGVASDLYMDTIICGISGLLIGLILTPLIFKGLRLVAE